MKEEPHTNNMSAFETCTGCVTDNKFSLQFLLSLPAFFVNVDLNPKLRMLSIIMLSTSVDRKSHHVGTSDYEVSISFYDLSHVHRQHHPHSSLLSNFTPTLE